MKTRSLWLLIIVGLVIVTTVVASSHQVDADIEANGTQYVNNLPFVTSPDIPPKIKLVPFSANFGSDLITAIVHAGDQRLFVAEREGRIRIVLVNGTTLEKPFLDISSQVVQDNWEEGLLGVAFHHNYPTVPYFFVTYTRKDHKIVLSRFAVSGSDPNQADADSELIMMVIPKPKPPDADRPDVYYVHNAGDLHFGPDSYLYIAIGDGGPDPWYHGGDPHNSGQGLDELLGNILRIDVNTGGGGLDPDCGQGYYKVPADNPFANGPGGDCDEVWSFGFRNPWRFSFDRQTGDMFIGDVGEWLREEINYQPAGSQGGENYGWHCYEGTVDYQTVDPGVASTCPAGKQFTMPIYEYDQTQSDCSVIGGYVYRGQQYPSLVGRYLFGDFCTGRMWLLSRSGQSWSPSFATAAGAFVTTLGEDVNGELFVGVQNGSGTAIIHRVTVVP